ncbi:MAG TPA: WGxxGxxG family protein [Streptomyces sp.]|nr:WGxxGxxG family protein [Streptomyces sp.]
MRKAAGTVLIALLLALAPAGTAFSQSTAEKASLPAVTATAQAQDNEDDDNSGLWGLFGLLGLAGLIPWRKNRDRDRQGYREGGTRSTGM